MATWRCLACDALYMAPFDSFGPVPHTCHRQVDDKTGRRFDRPGHRDENMKQDPDTGEVTIREAGAGRALLDPQDVLIGADRATIEAVRARAPIPPVPYPDPPARPAKVWPSRGTNR